MDNLVLVHLESVSDFIFHTNGHLFPNINKLLQESIYYPHYYSSATSTLMVMSDLCYGGMYRETCTKLENNFNNVGNHRSLFDELKDAGYHVKGIIWPEILTYSKIVNGDVLGKKIEVSAAEDYGSFIEGIDAAVSQKEPFALFVANFVSHVSYRNDKEVKGSNSYIRWKEGYRLVDDTCGKIIELLKKRGKDDHTLVVFYGDHGDDYWGHRFHNGYTHAVEPYGSITHTPLLFRNSQAEGGIDCDLMSSFDVKDKILSLLLGRPFTGGREYIFARNIYANQTVNFLSLSKGYAAATKEYLLLVSARGLELYNTDMDPANTCNLLEFFCINEKGGIEFIPHFRAAKSMHFYDFFTDAEIGHLRYVYRLLRRELLRRTEELYRSVAKDTQTRDRELNFYKINRYHRYHLFRRKYVDILEKQFRKRIVHK